MPRVIRRANGLIAVVYDRSSDAVPVGSYFGQTYGVDTDLLDKDGNPKPERPCARCGNQFQPTIRRRMLCAYCFEFGDFTGKDLDE